MEKVLQLGAEAIILKKQNEIIKKRLKKSYRISELDEKIRKLRTRSEKKLMERAAKIVNVPKIIRVDEKEKEIVMEFIRGKKLSESLDKFSLEKQKRICRKIGEDIARFHDEDIIHGDLTTSNMILTEKNESLERYKNEINSSAILEINKKNNKERDEKKDFKVFLIDFGLGFINKKIEDKAVDLHLFKEALEAKHFRYWQILFAEVIEGYKRSKNAEKVLQQLKKVETRGRYKKSY